MISSFVEAESLKTNFKLSYDINNKLFTREYNLEQQQRLFIPEFNVRGIYVTGWVAGTPEKMNYLIKMAEDTVINTMVIDVKEQNGYLSYKSDLEFAEDIGANQKKIKDVKNLIDELHTKGIYVIGRIVLFKDRVLARERRDLALRLFNKENLEVKVSETWVDPAEREVWDYNIGLAREAVRLGFDEIQFDYIRYPALAGSPFQATTLSNYPRSYYINNFARYAVEKMSDLDVPISIDVFGLTTTAHDDLGIGQNFSQLGKIIKIISPMVYPSHYSAGSYGIQLPEQEPYRVIHNSLSDARKKVLNQDEVLIRPWLQDFSMKHKYTYKEIREQIRAVEKLGIKEWLLWNPGSRYTEEALLNLP